MFGLNSNSKPNIGRIEMIYPEEKLPGVNASAKVAVRRIRFNNKNNPVSLRQLNGPFVKIEEKDLTKMLMFGQWKADAVARSEFGLR
jgi:hypothetical protein